MTAPAVSDTRTAGGRQLVEAFASASARGSRALIGYWMGGYPDLARCEAAMVTLARSGCDILELGIPFSDPVADGPTLQEAGARALAAGPFSLRRLLELGGRVRHAVRVPVVVMTYYNPVLQYGVERFARELAEVDLAGAIVPDLPVEEAGALRESLAAAGRAWVALAAPTSGQRLERVAQAADGFIYAVSRTGTTGARDDLPDQARALVESLKARSRLPVALGFGIGGPAQARAARYADGVVVGSAFATVWEAARTEGPDLDSALQRVGALAMDIKQALVGHGQDAAVQPI